MTTDEKTVRAFLAGWNGFTDIRENDAAHGPRELIGTIGELNRPVPDYINDLNAIRACVVALSPVEYLDKDKQVWSLRCEYLRRLEIIVFRDTGGARQEIQFELVNANAGQCAEALYGTLTNG